MNENSWSKAMAHEIQNADPFWNTIQNWEIDCDHGVCDGDCEFYIAPPEGEDDNMFRCTNPEHPLNSRGFDEIMTELVLEDL